MRGDLGQVEKLPQHPGVPQLGRGPALGVGCCWFKSSHPDEWIEKEPESLNLLGLFTYGRWVPLRSRPLARPQFSGSLGRSCKGGGKP